MRGYHRGRTSPRARASSDAEVQYPEIAWRGILRIQIHDRPNERAVDASDSAEDQHHSSSPAGSKESTFQPDELIGLGNQAPATPAIVAESV